jgi:hypothetical protein
MYFPGPFQDDSTSLDRAFRPVPAPESQKRADKYYRRSSRRSRPDRQWGQEENNDGDDEDDGEGKPMMMMKTIGMVGEAGGISQ